MVLRWSSNLTKDVLFVCLRDILRKIGEHAGGAGGRGGELRIELSVGCLVTKDRKISFEFDSTTLATVRQGEGSGGGCRGDGQ